MTIISIAAIIVAMLLCASVLISLKI